MNVNTSSLSTGTDCSYAANAAARNLKMNMNASVSSLPSLVTAKGRGRATTGGSTLKRKRQGSGAETLKSQFLHIMKSASVPASMGNKTTVEKSGDALQASPQLMLEKILSSKGYSTQLRAYDSLPDFFQELRQEEVDAYGLDVLRAVRESDIETLRKYHQNGRPLKCSNRFGESLLHLACRKALVPVVDFLVNEVEIPLCVKDDMGRTPLADAFWTIEPNQRLVDIILHKCPDLLLITDRRGHAPLNYARKEHWETWTKYLEKRKDLVLPKVLNQPFKVEETG